MESKLSIPEATNRKPALLRVRGPDDTAIGVVQVVQGAGPGEGGIELRRTPPVAAATNTVERPIVGT